MSRVHNTRRRRRNPDAATKALTVVDRTLTRVGVPRHNRYVYVAGGVLALGLAAYLSPKAYNRITYGKVVGGSTGLLGTGEDAPSGAPLQVDPATLAANAGVPLEVYSLARAVRSEAGGTSPAERQAVAWVICNEAKRLGKTITATVTQGKAGAGLYGSQNLGGRYVSTRYAPRQADVDLAAQVLSGQVGDNTGGATRFFNPSLQDRLFHMATKRYTKSAQDVIDGWQGEGYVMREVPGVDPSKFVVFAKPSGGSAVS